MLKGPAKKKIRKVRKSPFSRPKKSPLKLTDKCYPDRYENRLEKTRKIEEEMKRMKELQRANRKILSKEEEETLI